MPGQIDPIIKLLLVGLLSVTTLLLDGCHGTTRVVEVERVTHDTLYISNTHRDSIYLRDSVLIQQKGDTVYRDRWRYLYKELASTDTLIQHLRDTIPVPVTVEKTVHYIPPWGKFFIGVGIVAILALLLWLGWLYLRAR